MRKKILKGYLEFYRFVQNRTAVAKHFNMIEPNNAPINYYLGK